MSTLPSSKSPCPSRSRRPSTTRSATASARSRARACSCRTAGGGWSGSWSRTSRARRRARAGRCARVLQVLDDEPVLPAELLEVVLRAARDALCPPGVALAAAVPPGTAPRPGTRVALLPAGMRALERGELRGHARERAVGARQARRAPRPSCARAFPPRCPRWRGSSDSEWCRAAPRTDPPRVRARTERVYRRAPGLDLEAARQALARAPRQLELLQALGATPGAGALEPGAARAGRGGVRALRGARGRARDPRRSAGRAEPPRPSSPPHQRTALGRDRERRSRPAASRSSCCTASPAAARPRSTSARPRSRSRAGRARSCSCPRSRSPTSSSTASARASASASRCCTAGSRRGERFDQWRPIREGRVPIAIGARSAVFAPYTDLGLIVIDEEHEPRLQERGGLPLPRARRRAAARRARGLPARARLGDARRRHRLALRARRDRAADRCPSASRAGRCRRSRSSTSRAERARGARRGMLSRPLRQALAETLAAGQQAILFLNRRGFAARVYCFALRLRAALQALRHLARLPRERRARAACDDPLEGELRCHYCGYREDPIDALPERAAAPRAACRASAPSGSHEEVVATFPSARIGRLDRDTSARKGAQRAILAALPPRRARRPGRHADGREGPRRARRDAGRCHRRRPRPALPRLPRGRAHVPAADPGRGPRRPRRRAGPRGDPDLPAAALRDRARAARTTTRASTARRSRAAARTAGRRSASWCSSRFVRPARAARSRPRRSTLAGLAKTVSLDDLDGAASSVLGPAPAPLSRIRDEFRWQLLLLGQPREPCARVARELARQARGPGFAGVTRAAGCQPAANAMKCGPCCSRSSSSPTRACARRPSRSRSTRSTTRCASSPPTWPRPCTTSRASAWPRHRSASPSA